MFFTDKYENNKIVYHTAITLLRLRLVYPEYRGLYPVTNRYRFVFFQIIIAIRLATHVP